MAQFWQLLMTVSGRPWEIMYDSIRMFACATVNLHLRHSVIWRYLAKISSSPVRSQASPVSWPICNAHIITHVQRPCFISLDNRRLSVLVSHVDAGFSCEGFQTVLLPCCIVLSYTSSGHVTLLLILIHIFPVYPCAYFNIHISFLVQFNSGLIEHS